MPELAPAETLVLQYEFLKTGQYEEAYELFTEQSQRLVSRGLYSDFFAPTYEVSEYSVQSEKISGETAMVHADLVVTGSQRGTQRYSVGQEFVLEDRKWQALLRDDHVRVAGSEAFSGNYGTLASSRSVDGVAPAEGLDTGMFSADSVSALMQKTGVGEGELGVQLVVDSEVVQEGYTTAEYGVVQTNWSPSE